MKKITLLLALLISSIGFSQTTIQDFEAGGLGEAFGGAAGEIVADPETGGTRGQVAKLTGAAGEAWQGINVAVTSNYLLTTDKTIQMDVYSDTAITFAPKAQGGVDGAPESVSTASHTGSGWETLTVTFDQSLDGKAPANGEYSEMAIHYFWDTTANNFATASARVFYVDNIRAKVVKDLIQDFEAGGLGEAFGGAAGEIVADPETGGTRGQVAKLTGAAGEAWQGINVAVTSNYLLTTDKTIQMDVYSDTAITFAPKAQGGVDGAPESVSTASHTGSGWETLTVTFDQSLDGKAPANGEYSEMAIHYFWDTVANNFGTASARVFYVDNISAIAVTPSETCSDGIQNQDETGIDCGGTCSACPVPPTTAPTAPPTRNAWDVISLYSEAYTNVASNFDAGWCGPNSIEEVSIAGNNVQAFKGDNCQGIVLDAGIDASAFTNLHVDVYIEAGVDLTSKVFNLKFVQQPGAAALEINFNAASTPPLVAGSWIAIDVAVDLSTFTGFKEFGITAGTLKNQVWYDNLYVYRSATAGVSDNAALNVSMYPNPASGVLNISAANTIEDASIYNVLGTKVMSLNIDSNSEAIDVSGLSSGIYLIKYTIGDAVGTAKFIKE